MSVGGHIIEMRSETLTDDESTRRSKEVVRLWVVDRYGDETCVYAEPSQRMPELGQEIWWQSGRIYFDQDWQSLKKVGYSFSAPRSRS